MARRRYGHKRKGRRSHAIPVPLVIVSALPAINAWEKGAGGAEGVGKRLVYNYTGYNPTSNQWDGPHIYPLLGGVIAATVAHKIAGKVGVNSKLKKLTGGWLVI